MSADSFFALISCYMRKKMYLCKINPTKSDWEKSINSV